MILPEWFHRSTRLPYLLKVHRSGRHGPTVIFLHGLASFGTVWDPAVSKLSRTHRCVIIDLLGHGESPKPTHIAYTTEDHIRSLRWTIFWHGLWGRFTLVGHSMGSILSVRLARSLPKRISRLVLVSLPIYIPRDREGAEAQARFEGLIDSGLLSFYRAMRSAPQAWAIRSAKAIAKYMPILVGQANIDEQTWYPVVSSLKNTVELQHVTQDLHALGRELPIVAVYGTLDHVVLARNLKKAFVARPNSALVKILGGHEMNRRTAQEVAKAVEGEYV